MSVGEYAADARAAVAWLRAPPGGHARRAPRPLDGRRRLASSPPRPTRTSTPSIARRRARRPVAGSPARRSGSPGCRSRRRRVAARLAHDPRLPAAPRPHGRVRERDPRGAGDRASPVLLVHGTDDGVVPVDGPRPARRRPPRRPPGAVTETLLVDGGRHSWLYEFPAYRAAIARFLASTSAARSRPTRRPRSPWRSRPSASPTPSASRRSTRSPAASGRSPACSARESACRSGPRTRRRPGAAPSVDGQRAVPRRRPDEARRPPVRRPAARAGAPRPDRAPPGRRAHSSKNQQRWAFIVVEDRERLAALVDARAVRRAHRGRRGRDRARHARPAGPGPAAERHVGPRRRGGADDARRVGAGHRQLPGDRLRAGRGPASCWATRPACTASTSSRSATRPTRRC